MELLLAIQDGLGDGILAQPAVQIVVAKDWDDEKIDMELNSILRQNGEHALTAKVGYTVLPQIRGFVKYEDAPGEVPTLDRTHTISVGGELDLKVATLTADFSPDAYGAGRRSRFGIKSGYQVTPRVSVSADSKIRYLSNKDNWRPQTNVSMRYKLNPAADVSLNFIQHDFFDDATTLKYTLRAF